MYDLAALEAALAGTDLCGQAAFLRPSPAPRTPMPLAAARSGAPHGSVFFADEQTAGRGRGDHAWHSAAGQGLYVSVLLRPAIAVDHLPLLPLAAGLAAAEAIRAVKRARCGPALAQRSADWRSAKPAASWWSRRPRAGRLAFVVIGIGINVHQRDFDPGLATPATSLDLAAGRPRSAARRCWLPC